MEPFGTLEELIKFLVEQLGLNLFFLNLKVKELLNNIYMSFLPLGNDIESIFKSMKQNEDTWSEVQGIDIKDNIKDTLLEKYLRSL